VERLGGNPPALRDRLRDALSAKPRKGTEIIDVTFIDRSAKDAQVIVDTVLVQYVKYIREMSDATQDELYTQLVDQYKSLESEILGREKVTAELRQRLGTATPQELVSGQRVRLDEAQARLAEVRQRMALLDWEMKQIDVNDSNGAPAAEDIQKQLRYYEDDEWRRLDGGVRSLRHAIDTSVLTDKHPDAPRAQKDLAFAEELLRLREAQLDEQWQDAPKNAAGLPIATTARPGYQDDLPLLKYQMERAKYEEQLLVEDVNNQEKKFGDLFGSAQLLEKENTDLQHKRELFDAVRQRVDQKNMERNVPGSIEVLTRAVVPTEPYNDRRIVLTAMTMILALGLGGGVAFLKDSRNKAIFAPKDLPYPMQVPFLGYIPDIRGAKPSNGQAGHVLIEPTRVVRTALLSRLDGQGCTTVLVTSAAAGTGKSSFTLMLGKSLAQAGKKVLLIDADFAKMTLTSHFKNLSDQSGFIQSLRSGFVYRRHIFQTETSGLSIVPAGKKGDEREVLEEIANGAFQTCIDRLRTQYDVILLDSAPLLPLADAAILSGQVDGTIMVERELISRRTDVLTALARLGSAGGRLLGTVFIGSGSHEKYGYG
jgi:capsular exopolysaccharide synthesis family protein